MAMYPFSTAQRAQPQTPFNNTRQPAPVPPSNPMQAAAARRLQRKIARPAI